MLSAGGDEQSDKRRRSAKSWFSTGGEMMNIHTTKYNHTKRHIHKRIIQLVKVLHHGITSPGIKIRLKGSIEAIITIMIIIKIYTKDDDDGDDDDPQDRWKRQVQDQRRRIYDQHTLLN